MYINKITKREILRRQAKIVVGILESKQCVLKEHRMDSVHQYGQCDANNCHVHPIFPKRQFYSYS